MSEQKVGPWRAADYQSFLMLDTRDAEIASLRMPTPYLGSGLGGLGGLMSFSLVAESEELLAHREAEAQERRAKREAEIVGEAWAVRRAHPIYKSLKRDPDFSAACRAFELAVKRSKSEKLSSPTAPFKFLRVFVEHAGMFYRAAPLRRNKIPKKDQYGATAGRRSKAVKRAADLRELIAKGVGLEDFRETRNLDSLLSRLIEQLAVTRRKQYGGKRQFEREMLTVFAFSLISACDLKSPTVVGHFARIVNIPCDEKTAQRRCNEASRRHRLMLAKVLRDMDKKEAVLR